MGWAVVAGVMHGACFPPAGAWPLAFVALAPLLVAVMDRPPFVRFGLGWIGGTIAASIATTPWIAAAAREYFVPGPLGSVLLASLVGQLFHALPTGLFAVVAGRLQRLDASWARVLAVASAWTAVELLRSRALTGAPWDLLAHALYQHPRWLQIADVGGVPAVSFVLAAASAGIAEVATRPFRAAWSGAATAMVLVVVTAAYGTLRLADEDDGGPTLRVAVVQGSVPNAWRVDAARASEALGVMLDTTRPVLVERPRLVVWPENATSFLVAPNDGLTAPIAQTLGPDGPLLLFGGPRYQQDEPGIVRFFNAVYLLAPDGRVLATYDKRRLVPFGEYTPLPRIPALGFGFPSPGDYTPGETPGIFREPEPFGTLICFEAIYPDLARDVVRAGARFLVNVSNDAWFGTSAGLEQHFAISVFRAVETRRALVRATNTGVTALVAPSGRIVARFPAEERRAWVLDVPLRDDLTPYVHGGDAFAWLAVAVTVLAVVMVPARRRDV